MYIENELMLRYSNEDIEFLKKHKTSELPYLEKAYVSGVTILSYQDDNSTVVGYKLIGLSKQYPNSEGAHADEVMIFVERDDNNTVIGHSLIGFTKQSAKSQEKIINILVENLALPHYKHVTEQYPQELVVTSGKTKISIGEIFKYYAKIFADNETSLDEEEISAGEIFKRYVKNAVNKHNKFFEEKHHTYNNSIKLTDGNPSPRLISFFEKSRAKLDSFFPT